MLEAGRDAAPRLRSLLAGMAAASVTEPSSRPARSTARDTGRSAAPGPRRTPTRPPGGALSDLLERGRRRVSEAAAAELTDAFTGRLQFGTAGLRGALGPGPNRMNRVVVGQAAAGLATYLLDRVWPAAG